MGLWPSRASSDLATAQAAIPPATRAVAATATGWDFLPDRADRVGLADALAVPAFTRALMLFRGTIAAFPLREYPTAGPSAPVPRTFLDQPDPDAATAWVVGATVEDVLAHGAAYWWVTESGWDGFPSSARVLPAAECMEVPGRDPRYDPPIGVQYGDRMFPYALGRAAKSEAGYAIRFRYGHGVLAHGAGALRAALALEDATARYARDPVPQLALKNTGADLPEDAVLDLLDAWEEARRTRATAYLSAAVDMTHAGFDPQQLQMVEARNMAAVQVARLFNLDPVWIGAGVSGSSLTYANRVDLYRQLVDLSLSPVMAAIAGRLSMRDVSPRGHVVRFDTTAFLRDDPAGVSDFLAKVVPLGLVTADEGRDLLGLPPAAGAALPPEEPLA